MPEIELQFSGATQVVTPRSVIDVGGRPQRSLLAMLSLRVGENISADQLVEWSWGANLPDNPLGALQTRLSRLRSNLGDLREIVVSGRDSYLLDVPPESIDLARYEQANLEVGDDLERLVEIDSWWKGAPFADAESLDVLLDERSRLSMVWLEARGDIIDLLMAKGRYQEAFAWCERTLKHEPFDERIVASQLTLAAKLQMGKGFVGRYELWRERYREVFGSEPPDELDELADQIRGRTHQRSAPVVVPTKTDLAAVFDRMSDTPLFGNQAPRVLAEDSPTTVLLGGHGFGKTRLSAAWRKRRLDAGTTVLAARADDLVAVVEAVAAIDGDDESDIAIIVDDLHLASDGALDAFLATWYAHRSRYRFLVTSRPPQPGSRVQQALAELSMGVSSRVHKLAPLSATEIAELLVDYVDAEVNPSLVEFVSRSLMRSSGGHPHVLDFSIRGVISHLSMNSSSPNEAEIAPVIAAIFADEFDQVDGKAQALIALAAVTPRHMATYEINELVDELAKSGLIEPLDGDFGYAAISAAESTGLIKVGSERIQAIGTNARFTIRQCAPKLLLAASNVMQRRAKSHGDEFDLAVQRLDDPVTSMRDSLEGAYQSMQVLEARGARAELLELGDRMTEYGWLRESSDQELVEPVARIHLMLGFAAEQEGLEEQSNRHLGAALDLGVQHDLEDIVVNTGAGRGDSENPHRASPSGGRHSLAVAWADRRGSESARLVLEIDTLRRLRRRGLPVPLERLDAVEASLGDLAPEPASRGWAMIAEVLMAYPLSMVSERLDDAIRNGYARVSETPPDRSRYDDPELILHTVSGALALRKRHLSEADELIERSLGLASYRNHRLYTWIALGQRATFEAMVGNDPGWHRAVMKVVSWGRTYEIYNEPHLEWYISLAAQHLGLSMPSVSVTSLDRLDPVAQFHPSRALAHLSAFGGPADRERFEILWTDFLDRGINLLTPSALVFAARGAVRVGVDHLLGSIVERLEPYSGEYSVLPNGSAPCGDVDIELERLSERPKQPDPA